jgi:hypothetical protein
VLEICDLTIFGSAGIFNMFFLIIAPDVSGTTLGPPDPRTTLQIRLGPPLSITEDASLANASVDSLLSTESSVVLMTHCLVSPLAVPTVNCHTLDTLLDDVELVWVSTSLAVDWTTGGVYRDTGELQTTGGVTLRVAGAGSGVTGTSGEERNTSSGEMIGSGALSSLSPACKFKMFFCFTIGGTCLFDIVHSALWGSGYPVCIPDAQVRPSTVS